jgi:molybdate transport system substrate-binding protein
MTTSTTILLFAAGSLRAALSEVARAFDTASGHKVEAKFGPSGLLAAEIASGTPAHVFASANMAHPQALHDAGMSGPVARFARNQLCALVRPELNVTSETLLAILLDPAIELATSTPQADPSGDYAFEVFRKAESLKARVQVTLEQKALKLTGATDSTRPPAGRNVYGWHLAEGRADIFLTYRTNALAARKQYPKLQIVDLPAPLAVGAEYGLTLLNGTPAAARSLADAIMSPAGQAILARHGFAAAAEHD